MNSDCRWLVEQRLEVTGERLEERKDLDLLTSDLVPYTSDQNGDWGFQVARSRIGALRDDRKLSPSRERSERLETALPTGSVFPSVYGNTKHKSGIIVSACPICVQKTNI